jgi:hypothetical protein
VVFLGSVPKKVGCPLAWLCVAMRLRFGEVGSPEPVPGPLDFVWRIIVILCNWGGSAVYEIRQRQMLVALRPRVRQIFGCYIEQDLLLLGKANRRPKDKPNSGANIPDCLPDRSPRPEQVSGSASGPPTQTRQLPTFSLTHSNPESNMRPRARPTCSVTGFCSSSTGRITACQRHQLLFWKLPAGYCT